MTKKRQRAAGRRGEIVFDPEARKDYLRGFSDRKRKRRMFGLAMQKVKDRKAKIDQRAEEKLAIKEQIEQAEKQKEELLEEIVESNKKSIVHTPFEKQNSDDELYTSAESTKKKEAVDKIETYQDDQTQSQWGGEVVVTLSERIPGDSDDEAPPKKVAKRKKTTDEEQEFAGNVEKFMGQLKGKMPGKRKKDSQHHAKHKGKHGAAKMKGMATGGDMKIAQKALQRSQGKQRGGKAAGHGHKRNR